MIVGIVGAEEAKFTKSGRQKAKLLIRLILSQAKVTEVVSGGCHLGGIDKWAIEIGRKLGLETTEFLPKFQSWTGGYMERNLQIADRSDIVYSITVDKLPKDFVGMRFSHCYHCHSKDHVKSGGCWTMKQAIKKGKKGKLEVVEND